MIQVEDKKIYFPIRYVPNTQQLGALEFIKHSINNKKRFICLNLATGTGKSLLGVSMFANYYRNYIDSSAKIDIITGSKILQEQYLRDFDFINSYKGQSNYYCKQFDCQCDTGRELCKVLKNSCSACPYEIAKNKWIDGDIGITNFHLFSTLSLYQPDIIKRRASNVLIVDECHLLEGVFSDYLNCKISSNILKKCGFQLKEIETIDDRFISKIKFLDKYIEFLERKLAPMMEEKLVKYETEIKNSHSKKKLEITKFIQNLEGKLLSFRQLFLSYKDNPGNVVLEVNINKNEKMFSGVELISQNIWVHDILYSTAFKNYDHILFMSGTILNKDVFSYINGLDSDLTSYYEVDTPFKRENRMIYYLKIGRMSRLNKEETFQKQIPWINKILEKYKNKKGIIHCNTYELAEWVKENVQNSRLIFHDNENKDEMLEKHIQSTEPCVIVSPSMTSGVDLKGDLAEFSIILKVPFPNLGSKKISARQKMNKDWYSLSTISELIQTTGRGVRGDDDRCDTYILDSNFSDLLKYNSHMIPKYFTDAIKTLKV